MYQLMIDMVSALKELTGFPVSVNQSDKSIDCIVIQSITRPKDDPVLSLDKTYSLESTTLSIYVATARYEHGSKIADQIISAFDSKQQTIGNTQIHLGQLLHSTSVYESDKKHHVFSIDLDLTHSNVGDES